MIVKTEDYFQTFFKDVSRRMIQMAKRKIQKEVTVTFILSQISKWRFEEWVHLIHPFNGVKEVRSIPFELKVNFFLVKLRLEPSKWCIITQIQFLSMYLNTERIAISLKTLEAKFKVNLLYIDAFTYDQWK